MPADQRYRNAYLFGAICPARGVGAALMLPKANTHAMQLHLDEISRCIASGSHGVLLMDRAGWHTTGKLNIPANITIILLPCNFRCNNQPLIWPVVFWISGVKTRHV